ncbi:hypothetical protein ANN_03211 [Periplaneta americana]|uniref:Uncharacterized protein n=1 Tax=Periplaneta americana TaxID=6978 RepID=A0ABQ8U3D1_PERAM|nr:hypothetical protein ANN_03211 [Periplaneta americana]
MRISRMLCPELCCVITFKVLCEAQFIEKLCGTVCSRVSDWTCFGKPPAKAAMQNLVEKWRETGSVANKNRNYPKRVRTPENIARVQESLKQSPTKSQLTHFPGQFYFSQPVVHSVFVWKYLLSYKTKIVR